MNVIIINVFDYKCIDYTIISIMPIILLYRLLLFLSKLLTRMIFTRNTELISKTITIGNWYIQSSTYETIKGQYLSYVIWLYKSNWIKNEHQLLILSLQSALRARVQ